MDVDPHLKVRLRERSKGATSFDAAATIAFGAAIRNMRTAQGLPQDTLAGEARIERSPMGKIERGQHIPNLSAILKLAAALGCTAADLVAATEALLPPAYGAL